MYTFFSRDEYACKGRIDAVQHRAPSSHKFLKLRFRVEAPVVGHALLSDYNFLPYDHTLQRRLANI